ncbi:MAG: BTAD domain-containing putative transcriptional regulator [Chloroflexota bacterium]
MTSNYALELFCFRGFQTLVDGQKISDFRTVRGQAMLAYVAVEQAVPTRRETLAGLLWPDESERNARRNLSQSLFHLRHSLQDQTRTPPFLRITPHSIELNLECDSWVDVVRFEAHLMSVQQHSHANLSHCRSCIAELEQAVALYQGPFLDGFSVPTSDLFELWLVTKREELQQQALDAFAKLSKAHEENEDFEAAQRTLRRTLALMPDHESAHQQLMRVFVLSGQRSRALAQYETCRQILNDELGVDPSLETIALYEQIRDGLLGPKTDGVGPSRALSNTTDVRDADANHAVQSSVAPFQSLVPPPHFVGRTDLLESIRATVYANRSHALRLQPIALVGMGGVGKTAVAAQAAHLLREAFGDGVLWANLGSSAPIDILATWARAYDYDFSNLPDVESRAAALRGMLAEKRVLIVIDNVLSTAEVHPLLPSSPHCTILLTMRDLDVAHALNAQVLMLTELSPSNGRALFVQILGEERVAVEEEAASEICTLLQNLPLAVEIVAQRLKSRPRQRLGAMATRLRDERYRLGLEISDQAVRTSFEVSWRSLDETLQQLFAYLAIFGGRPFQAEAIAAIMEVDSFEAEDNLYALEALSLLRSEGDAYYCQHPLLSDFAHEKLAQTQSDESRNAFERMSTYYLEFVAEHSEALDTLIIERENIMSAIEIAYSQNAWERLFAYADIVTPIALQQGIFGDVDRLCEWVHVGAKSSGNRGREAMSLAVWGEAQHRKGQYDDANRSFMESLQLYEPLEDRAGMAHVQERLATIAMEKGDVEEASRLAEACLANNQILESASGIADAYYLQASLLFLQGTYAESFKKARESLTLREACNNTDGQIHTLSLLAHIESRKHSFRHAQGYAEQAVDIGRAEQLQLGLASALYALAIIYRNQKQHESALAVATESLQLFKQMGLRRTEGQLLYQISFFEENLGNVPHATELANQSLQIFQEISDEFSAAYSLIQLGDLYDKNTQSAKANHAWKEAHQIANGLNNEELLLALEKRLNNA